MKDKLKILGVCGPTKYFRSATVMVGVYPSGGGTSLVSDPGTPDQSSLLCLHVWFRCAE